MNFIDALERYKVDLEEKISCIYYESDKNGSMSEDNMRLLGKYVRRLEFVDRILSVLDKNKLIKK